VTEPAPRPLPFTVKPHPGERYTDYIRRLAQVNHLQPSLLRAYVNANANSAAAFRLDRLAAVSGRTPEALRRTLIALPSPKLPAPPGAQPSRFTRYYPRRKVPRTPEARLAQDLNAAAEELRYLDELALFDRIRADHQIVGMTIAKLARTYMLDPYYVRDIVHGRLPGLPGGKREPKPAPTFGPVKDLIRQLWRAGLPADRIWSELVDNHGAAISKNTVKIYLRDLRHGAVNGA
jgi:hypothetical protein